MFSASVQPNEIDADTLQPADGRMDSECNKKENRMDAILTEKGRHKCMTAKQ